MYLCHIVDCAVACAVGTESVNVGLHVKDQVAVGGNIGCYDDQGHADRFEDGELAYLDSFCWRLGLEAATARPLYFAPTARTVGGFLDTKLWIEIEHSRKESLILTSSTGSFVFKQAGKNPRQLLFSPSQHPGLCFKWQEMRIQ